MWDQVLVHYRGPQWTSNVRRWLAVGTDDYDPRVTYGHGMLLPGFQLFLQEQLVGLTIPKAKAFGRAWHICVCVVDECRGIHMPGQSMHVATDGGGRVARAWLWSLK